MITELKNAPHDGKRAASLPERLPFDHFVWGAGLECSFLPHLDIDQFAWTQHNRFWRQDLRRAKDDLGLSHLRYSLPWHVLESQRGKLEWKMADERIELCRKLGIELILDVMHFGTPLWLKQAVGDPEFPESLERFTEEMVTRYRGAVKRWCPCNEPSICALFSGDYGFWPPHARKWKGYMPVLSRVVMAVSRSIRAIRRCMPEGTVVLCDSAEHYKTRDPSLRLETERRNLRRFAVMDLLAGMVDQAHPLRPWLVGYGMSELDMEWFRANPQRPDVLGLDYYPHTDWQLEIIDDLLRQRRADIPAGVYGVAKQYYERYGIPLMVTETSIEGAVNNRQIWFDQVVRQIARLRAEGVPMLGLIWWPALDQIDWDGAMTHRIGKIHEVGLLRLQRQADGTLRRLTTPMAQVMRQAAEAGDELVGELAGVVHPRPAPDQGPPIGELFAEYLGDMPAYKSANETSGHNGNGNGSGHGNGRAALRRVVAGKAKPAPAISTIAKASLALPLPSSRSNGGVESIEKTATGQYGIVVFSHLRWGFVWQRPQQFLSRLARQHPVLFIEEPCFDRAEGKRGEVQFHRVMPNVVVACPHLSPSWNRNPALPEKLLEYVKYAIGELNDSEGSFDRPLLWYYSPMDASWSLGHVPNRGIVYDAMDELSQFNGAPPALIANERRLMEAADIVFTGGHELSLKKKERHHNVHFFGCGVEFDHFAQAHDADASIPPDIDFMARPILGWFGVVDERVDYGMVGDMARMRPFWSFAMVGPVVKVDPNFLPHFPNLYWMGQRDYQVLPNYCRAFDVCMMPFALNAATQYINPTKALEYMATGRPVISTAVADVVRLYGDVVHVVGSAEEFIAAAERAIERPDRNRIARGIKRAQARSWDNTVHKMHDLITEAIADPERLSRRKIKPLPRQAIELVYQYRATPGS